MTEEIAAAVVFLKRLIQKSEILTNGKVEEFSKCLSAILVDKFKNHWYRETPAKGQGYRCIRVNPADPVDSVLERAAVGSGIQYEDLNLPMEMTLWVDPGEVCCRVGETKPSYFTVAVLKDGLLDNKAHALDVDYLLEKAKELYNLKLNITTTRTNNHANKNRNFFNNNPQIKPGYPKQLQVSGSSEAETKHSDNSENQQKKRSSPDNHKSHPANTSHPRQQSGNPDGKKHKSYPDNHKQHFGHYDNQRQHYNGHMDNHWQHYGGYGDNCQQHFGIRDNQNQYSGYYDNQRYQHCNHGDSYIFPPPPVFQHWQPGAYSPPSKNLNSSFRKNSNFNHKSSKNGPSNPSSSDRFHWNRDGNHNTSSKA